MNQPKIKLHAMLLIFEVNKYLYKQDSWLNIIYSLIYICLMKLNKICSLKRQNM